jgi:hypothetical protein
VSSVNEGTVFPRRASLLDTGRLATMPAEALLGWLGTLVLELGEATNKAMVRN